MDGSNSTTPPYGCRLWAPWGLVNRPPGVWSADVELLDGELVLLRDLGELAVLAQAVNGVGQRLGQSAALAHESTELGVGGEEVLDLTELAVALLDHVRQGHVS